MTIQVLFPEGAVNQSFAADYESLIRKALEGKAVPHPSPFVGPDHQAPLAEQLLITQTAEFTLTLAGPEKMTQTHFLNAGHTVVFPLDPNRAIH
jgi:hypothetical protein